jgi:hypothetical protein
MDEKQVKDLLERYNAGQCSDEERALLETWYLEHNRDLPHGLSAEKIREATDRIEARLDRVLPGRKVVPLLRYAAAACLLVGMGVGGYFLPRKPDVAPVAVVMKHDVAPG